MSWLGAVVVYLALATASLTSDDARTAQAGFLVLHRVAYSVIVPLSLAALLSGLVQSLGTEWGLFRHYWILVKFLLTIAGITVLLLHLPTVSRLSRMAADPTFSASDFGTLRLQLVVHAAGGLLVLLTATALSVYKPWGRTSHGRRTLARQLAS